MTTRQTLLRTIAIAMVLIHTTAFANQAGVRSPGQSQDIVDTAVAAGQFKTLAAALGAAGLVDTLKGPGPFTVFAPTDAAFAALPAGTIETLLADPTGLLTDILLYHAVAGVAMSTDLTDGMMVTTLNACHGGLGSNQ